MDPIAFLKLEWLDEMEVFWLMSSKMVHLLGNQRMKAPILYLLGWLSWHANFFTTVVKLVHFGLVLSILAHSVFDKHPKFYFLLLLLLHLLIFSTSWGLYTFSIFLLHFFFHMYEIYTPILCLFLSSQSETNEQINHMCPNLFQ
jgi:hypothetical protein